MASFSSASASASVSGSASPSYSGTDSTHASTPVAVAVSAPATDDKEGLSTLQQGIAYRANLIRQKNKARYEAILRRRANPTMLRPLRRTENDPIQTSYPFNDAFAFSGIEDPAAAMPTPSAVPAAPLRQGENRCSIDFVDSTLRTFSDPLAHRRAMGLSLAGVPEDDPTPIPGHISSTVGYATGVVEARTYMGCGRVMLKLDAYERKVAQGIAVARPANQTEHAMFVSRGGTYDNKGKAEMPKYYKQRKARMNKLKKGLPRSRWANPGSGNGQGSSGGAGAGRG